MAGRRTGVIAGRTGPMASRTGVIASRNGVVASKCAHCVSACKICEEDPTLTWAIMLMDPGATLAARASLVRVRVGFGTPG